MNPVKFIMNLFISLFMCGIIAIPVIQFGIDPAPMSYGKAVLFFSIICAVAWIFKYLLCTYAHKERNYPIALYSNFWEFVMYLLFVLILPFTGDLGA
ncbi:hypothetical protein [Ornithobacterium rhinotracheale]|uniref:hypothetical protein n=1 Tax=Ornithobacterium rhinotracheale TaxID=28251 RepID=UPI001FF3218A|nr:hypothetical protein [Ornithobacterium rhinotracheale]MCK0201365.1 hypothetical protein [Ornithobacterium rhinotracheale]